ncbi:MAG: class I SAM-dependent methyltransferase [Sphingobacteriales bacterium]|nr:MAG: class I SAM-dependent methyltransferase [Sphingobacteriales bacterium]
MNQLLKSVFESKTFTTKDKKCIQIHSETGKEQCDFLQRLISENKFSNSIEIGFAYGISALAITEEIVKNNGRHVIIDKFENTGWDGVGLDLIAQAGYSQNIDFHEEFCYIVLPKLLEEGRKFDFAYIDSTKQLDWLLVDFFFLDKLLIKNGIIVFDDVSFPGIRKLLRYISQFPDYKVYDTFPKNQKSHFGGNVLTILKMLPKTDKYLKSNITLTDFDLGINSHCVALQKVNDDSRNWDWHKDF